MFVFFLLFSLQTILGVSSLEEVINPKQVIPQYIMYNMTNTSKHGVVVLQDKSGSYQQKKLDSLNLQTKVIAIVGVHRDHSVEGGIV